MYDRVDRADHRHAQPEIEHGLVKISDRYTGDGVRKQTGTKAPDHEALVRMRDDPLVVNLPDPVERDSHHAH